MIENIPRIDFFVTASPRSGTTWLQKCLQDHPQVCFSIKKEFVPFGENGRLLYKETEEQFARCTNPQALRGTMPIIFNAVEDSSKWIKKYYPNAKIIMCFRNPMERAYSNYKYNISRGFFPEKLSFTEIIHKDQDFLKRGLYARALTNYWRDFSKENVLVLFSEDMASKQLESLRKVQRFLKIEERDSDYTYTYMSVSRVGRKIYNSALIFQFRKFLLHLNSMIRKIGGPKAGELISKLKLGAFPNWLSRINYKKRVDGRPEESMEGGADMNKKDREYLRQYYAQDIQELSKLLGEDIDWK